MSSVSDIMQVIYVSVSDTVLCEFSPTCQGTHSLLSSDSKEFPQASCHWNVTVPCSPPLWSQPQDTMGVTPELCLISWHIIPGPREVSVRSQILFVQSHLQFSVSA